jgi:hypothetical protein
MVGDPIRTACGYAPARGLLPLKVRAFLDFAAPRLKAMLERDLT